MRCSPKGYVCTGFGGSLPDERTVNREEWDEMTQTDIDGCGGAVLVAGRQRGLGRGRKVVIGDIDDMSGPYADVIRAGGIEAIRMAIADFGGTALGKPIEVLTFDHRTSRLSGRRSCVNGPTRTA